MKVSIVTVSILFFGVLLFPVIFLLYNRFRRQIKEKERRITERSQLSQIKEKKSGELKKIKHYKNKPTILVVGDKPDLLYDIGNLFFKAEYNAYVVENGVGALEKLKEIPLPDVIILDIIMDTIDGSVLFDHIRNNPTYNTIPFIFLSEGLNNNDIIKGFKYGAVDFILKPINNTILIARVTALIKFIHKKELYIRKESSKVTGTIKSLPIDENKYLKYGITKQQRKILGYKQQGLTYKNIGKNMGITEGAVKSHISTIKQKTGLYDINEIIRLFFYDYDKKSRNKKKRNKMKDRQYTLIRKTV